MKVQITFRGVLTEEVKAIVADDMTSPSCGYTQKHADELGKSYENGRASELLGDDDCWEWQSSTYLN